MSETQQKTELQFQENYRNPEAVRALDSLLTSAGFDAGDLQVALRAIQQAKEQSNKEQQVDNEYKNFLDRTLVYDDQDAFIYKRGDTKSGRWYLRIYDKKNTKPVIKSLQTTDKVQALATARLRYLEIKGKIERGERLKSLTIPELVEIWDKKLKDQITDIPHEGIVKGSYIQKRQFLNHWLEYINHLSLSKTPIDKIDPSRTRDFGTWLKNRPKHRAYKSQSRSLEQVNSNISEIRRMYNQLAIRDKYISANQIPEIDKVKVQRDSSYKRDILNEEQYEELWKYIQYNYITKKHNPERTDKQLEKRKIWKEFIFIISNVGFRPKELLGMKLHEIMENHQWDSKRRETDVLMKVRKENSKTGRARVCVAPVKKRITRILDSYKKLGITHDANDYLFLNPDSKQRLHYTRDIMAYRLKTVVKDSGIQDDLDKENKSITLYSFRHQYAAWRLRYGDVPIHLLAKQMGTSIKKIESTYGHIQVEQQADVITKAQAHIKRTGLVLKKPEVIEDESQFISQSIIAGANYQTKEVIKNRQGRNAKTPVTT